MWWLTYPKASEFFYDGEGEYTVDGIWPFLTYKLKMPKFSLNERYEQTYYVRRYATDGGDHFSLCFETDESFDYLSVDARAKLEVVTSDGRKVFSLNEPLNDPDRFADVSEQEYRVLQVDGFGRWRTHRIASREVREAECFWASWTELDWRLQFNWWENYELRVSLSDVDKELAGARVHVEIVNGWK